MPVKIIHDGDHGGDDFITTLLFLAYPEIFDLKAITTVTGNAGVTHTTRNALLALDMAGRTDIPVYRGADKPLVIDYRLGDDAFGSDGLGNISLESQSPELQEQGQDAIIWLHDYLQSSPDPITLCVTGPATNIALLLQKFPHIKTKIKQMVIMGGGVEIGGNIKPYAEFNFYMDPDAAHIVLNAGIPVVLHTLDTTQQAIYTKARQDVIRAMEPSLLANKIDAIMRITEELEKKAFGAEGSFFHDHQVAAYLAMPDNYKTRKVHAEVLCEPASTEGGRLVVSDDPDGHVELVTAMIDSDRFFAFVKDGLERILKRHTD